MHRCLWNQAIREGDEEYAADESSHPEKEEVPVEAARFLQWKLFRLGGDAAYILSIALAGHDVDEVVILT